MMKIRVELTAKEMEEAGCDSIEEFKADFIHQLKDGVIGPGEFGEDWLPDFAVEIAVV